MHTTSQPLVTVPESLLLAGLLLFAVGYVLAVLVVTHWLHRDATRRGRRADLWAAAVGLSLLSGGLVGIVLLAWYLRSRAPEPVVATES
jgi:MFS family permease